MEKINLPIEKEELDEVSPKKPDFKWFWKMIWIIIAITAISYFSVWLFSKVFIENISIEREKEIFGKVFIWKEQKLFDKKILWDNLWEIDSYDIYILKTDVPNAYASIWANITVTTGLLERAKTKEEILFILGHELSHIKNRDTLRALTRSMPFTAMLQFLGIDFWNDELNMTSLISNYYSREAERAADKWWIEYLNSLKMNWECATWFFKRIGWNEIKFLEFTKTHPINKDRIEFIEQNSAFKWEKCNDFKYKK